MMAYHLFLAYCRPRLMLILAAALLLSGTAQAAPQDVDLTGANPNPAHEFNLLMGSMFNSNIGVLNAAADVFWEFAATPFGATSSDGFATNFTIHGVTITLPAGTPDEVPSSATATVSGTPTASGSFSFTVTVSDGTNTRNREYELLIERPLDLVLLLDRSGSMTETTSSGGTRWQALRDAVGNFGNFYQALNRTNDRIAITYFETDLTPASACCNGLTAVTNTIGTTISNELNTQPVEGWTALGSGMKDAQGKLSDVARSRTVLLFTDGEQNQDPTVNSDGLGYSDASAWSGGGAPGNVKIFTIGIGNPSGEYLTTLQNLANNNRGTYNITTDGSAFAFGSGNPAGDLSLGFTNQFVNLLAEFSPQLVARTDNNTTGTGPFTLQTFPLNRRVDKLLIQLTTDQKFETPQLAQFLARIQVLKDSVNVTSFAQPSWVGNYTGTILLTFDFPATQGQLTPEGDWTVRLADVTLLKVSRVRVTTLADDHRLDYSFSRGQATPRVGAALQPTVTLSWLGHPVTGATVEAVIFRPNDDLGDALANNPFQVDLSSVQDAGSPGVQKFNALLAGDSTFRNVLRLQENVVTLAHTGNGRYEGTFNGLNVAGIYQIVYRIRGTNDTIGEYQREATESFYTSFAGVDLDASAISTQLQGNILVMTITPVTPYGKKVGPAMGSSFTVDNPNVQIDTVIDNQDGSYTINFSGNIDEPVSLQLLGQEIYQGELGNIGEGGSIIDRIQDWLESLGLPGWSIWLLLLLLILLLVWLIRRVF